MTANLHGVTVAILVTDNFEQVEMTEPRQALDGAGAPTRLVSTNREMIALFGRTRGGQGAEAAAE